MSAPDIEIQWTPRRTPLRPVAAAARGDAARHLAQRLLQFSDEQLANLRGVAAPDLLLLWGEQDDLPWVDGVHYLGRARKAPDLLVPTTLEPTVPESLLARAIAHAKIPPPVAILVDRRTLVSFAEARPLHRETLQSWCASPQMTT